MEQRPRRRGRPLVPVLVAFALLLIVVACSDDDRSGSAGSTDPAELARSGGDATVFDDSANAFALSIPTLTAIQRRAFSVGNNFFNDNWVTAPASTTGRDGLGPLFNAQSCSSCHFRDGRAAPPSKADPSTLGLLLRLSVPGKDEHGGPLPDPHYGGQLQDRSINGVPAEGEIEILTKVLTGTYGDGSTYELVAPTYSITDPAYGEPDPDLLISPRIAPPVFGVGLLEAIPEKTIRAAADPDDANNDGISGKPNEVWDADLGRMALGRFGWKANVATAELQTTHAFQGDIGITSELLPDQPCTPVQTACLAAPEGGQPEIDPQKLDRVVFYTRTLAVPARRKVGEPATDRGAELFTEIGCASCHTPEVETGDSDIPALAHQTIRPYTDLLLHDMGKALADDRPDFLASPSEWRTPPLWGIGLTKTVNRHTKFLHDGRARNLTEAILWHGGEAAAAQKKFRNLDAEDRAAVVAFLESL